VRCAAVGWPQNASVDAILFIPEDTILCPESGTLASFNALPVGLTNKKPTQYPFVFTTLVEPWITAAYF
jgi:hypothetical protein